MIFFCNHFCDGDCHDCNHFIHFTSRFDGTFGDFGAFSLYPTKNLGALGDAGIITTNNKEHYDKLLHLRNYGSKIKYHNIKYR